MKILFIGGTGTISMAITGLLAERGEEVYQFSYFRCPVIATSTYSG